MKHNVDSFVCKKEINWNLDENGVLTLEGQGKIPNYDCGRNPSAPWKNVNDQIMEIRIMEGITGIGMNTFRDCENLKKVALPDSLGRIQAYAFWNCKQLVCIESDRTDFKYIYDDRDYEKDDTVIFGIESFHNVPWCNARWGDFYSHEGILYITFAGEAQNLVIPKGICVLKSFSMNHLDVTSILLPDTLEVIENFVFSDSTVKKHFGEIFCMASIL